MRHFIRVDPEDAAVIHVGDLEHRVHSGVSSAPFAENDLSHPPIGIGFQSDLLLCLDDHVVTRPDIQERWRLRFCH